MRNVDFRMDLKRAECPVKVAEIVEKTIRTVYPHYYPSGAVQFFLDLHNKQRIWEALAKEDIYFAEVQGEIVGTGSIRGNEICRLFILPEYQAKGYGNRLMDFLEDMVFRKYQTVHIDASFPAESMYLKRGYRIKSYEKIETGGGDYLCYHTMEKAALLPVERVFPEHHSLDIQPEMIGRMRDAFRGLKEGGKLRHGSGTFDYGDWAVWL